jgi:hypothetical protein
VRSCSIPSVYQHAGKCAYDFGDWAAAIAHFREALRLREALGDPESIESTRHALDAVDACTTSAEAAARLAHPWPGHGRRDRPVPGAAHLAHGADGLVVGGPDRHASPGPRPVPGGFCMPFFEVERVTWTRAL